VTTDSIVAFHLYQALPNKYEKIEYILQKWVEVGISRFVFFRSDRSQKLIISETKKARFRGIIQEALEQCGGNRFPELEFVENIEFDRIFGERILFHTIPWESVSLGNVAQTLFPTGKLPKNISLFVGSEGGFSPEEILTAKESGVEIVHFGSRILRTETVSSVVVFYLQQLL
jgi:16S rRNA (uracil1498-N3)-methyltransferase